MIKKQKKWIALFVTLTFVWLLQVSTMPAAAAGTTEQVSSAGTEQGPRFIEEDSGSGSRAKKKSPLPFILIGVGLVAVTVAVLFLLVLKGYDITGSWTVYFTWSDGASGSGTITFSGDKKAGTFMSSDGSGGGTYAVDGKNVTFTFSSNGTRYTGTFTDKENMSGTMVSGGSTGTWTATKNAGAAAVASPLAAGGNKRMDGAREGSQ